MKIKMNLQPKGKYKVCFSTSTQSLGEQIRLVIESDQLTVVKKQAIIESLKDLAIPKEIDGEWVVEGPINQVWFLILDYYPELIADMEERVVHIKNIPLPKKEIFGYIMKIMIYLLVVSLRNRLDISKNVFLVHLTLMISRIIKERLNIKSVSVSQQSLNELIKDVITFDIHLAQINVKSGDKLTKAVGKMVLKLIQALVDHKLIKETFHSASRPTDLVMDAINSKIGPKAKVYRMIVLSLNDKLKYDLDPFLSLFFDEGPQLIPKKVNSDNAKGHLTLSNGISELNLYKKGKETLNIANQVAFRYNWSLYEKAKKEVTGSEQFTLSRKMTKEDCEKEVRKWRLKFIEEKVIPRKILKLEKLEAIRLYFEESENPIFTWFKSLCNPNKKSDEWKLYYREILKIDIKFGELVISNLLKFVIQYIKALDIRGVAQNGKEEGQEMIYSYSVTIKQIEHYLMYKMNLEVDFNITTGIEFSLDKDYLNYFSSVPLDNLKKVINSCISNIKSILYIFSSLGIDKLSNLGVIAKLFKQVDHNIFLYGSIRVVKEVYLTNKFKDLLSEGQEYSREYFQSVRNYSMIISIAFKEQMMDLYKNVDFYFTTYVAVNGRLGYKGFSPHPHSGEMFRFLEKKCQIVKAENLQHLKLSISNALGNKFKTRQAHLEGFEQNKVKLNDLKKENTVAYVYIDAGKNSVARKPTGTLVRIDQVASALTYGGLLSGCSFYQKITNIGEVEQIDPYLTISQMYIIPLLKQIEIEGTEKLPTLKIQVVKKQVLTILKEVGIPGAKDRTFLKYLLMPHAYGLTNIGVQDKLIEYVKDYASHFKYSILKLDSGFKVLSLKIWHQLNKVSPKTQRLKQILQKVYEEIQCQNLTEGFSTKIKFTDCAVAWDYKKIDLVQTNVGDSQLKYSRSFYIRQMMPDVDREQNKRSFLALLVHSIDAAVIRKVIRICSKEYNFTPITIHDCALGHPNEIDFILQAFKRSIFEILGSGELTNKVFLEKIGLLPSLDKLDKDIQDKVLQKWENLGNKNKNLEFVIQVNKIFESDYNFSYE